MMPLRVFAGDRQCCRRSLQRPHAQAGPGFGNGDRDRTAAGAEIGDRAGSIRRQPGQRQLDQQFGLRARDQYRRRDREQKPEELALAEQISDRLARRPRRDQALDFSGLHGIELAFAMREQGGAR